MKNGELKIEKGVPIPERSGRGKGEIGTALSCMKKGDSVLLPGVYSTAWQQGKYYFGKGNFRLHKEGNGTRIWRTK